MAKAPAAVSVRQMSYRYREREAIRNLSFDVPQGEIFVMLGPNGSGKTTLFRVLSTLIPLQQGEVQILGNDLRTQVDHIRPLLGVVFQAPSIDKKLTVFENLRHHGHLYGMSGAGLRIRIEEALARLSLADRAKELTEKLSGGLRRRVELAKAMLHEPRVLILDEPSTGLDPGARSDLWRYLEQVRREMGVTVLLTTHLLEEAARADRIAILHRGELVALDTPGNLQASIGGDSLLIRSADPAALVERINKQFGCDAFVLDGAVRLEQPRGHEWVPRLAQAFPQEIESITLGKPTLEDVFIARTGHRFFDE
ncbi:MAG: ABC transporter ATP-binding protein [Pirellulales bacterium]